VNECKLIVDGEKGRERKAGWDRELSYMNGWVQTGQAGQAGLPYQNDGGARTGRHYDPPAEIGEEVARGDDGR